MDEVRESPAFLQEDLPDTKPGLDGLKVGSEVLVVEPRYRRRHSDQAAVKAVVINKARVWITVEETSPEKRWKQVWRFRLDDQTDGSQSGYAAKFYTPEQYRLDRAVSEAREFLEVKGINVTHWTPWNKDPKIVELAQYVWWSDRDNLWMVRHVLNSHPQVTVSVDVSTGDHDYDRRIFGTVTDVQADSNGAPVLLAESIDT